MIFIIYCVLAVYCVFADRTMNHIIQEARKTNVESMFQNEYESSEEITEGAEDVTVTESVKPSTIPSWVFDMIAKQEEVQRVKGKNFTRNDMVDILREFDDKINNADPSSDDDGLFMAEYNKYHKPRPPAWVRDLKTYIRQVKESYGKQSIEEYIAPLIKTIEEEHEVIIKNVDVIRNGEILINYESKTTKPTTISEEKAILNMITTESPNALIGYGPIPYYKPEYNQ